MKKLISAITLAILLATGSAYAAPSVVSDDFTASMVDSCTVVFDEVTSTFAPTPTTTGNARCEFDVGGVSNGAHQMSMNTSNMWGVSDPIPFSFTKELPPNISGIRLE